ncbi:DUF1419 domain-containing protein [Rhizobium rhizogenes]|uniref:DUF1419 domain-containing protein n=1 Tax=Rhizobium rhizogenes TaxID=359 RepID=A0AA92BZY1_RHIRH|nr:DUF1419 domain-containing protein [Rhizobium rhizogenes]PVE50652.1 hypothetical protein DC430_20955 [Rhizobium rhizogenes]PVE62347.1 hypothetical protein DC415_22375 [Agrobacterium tumefaciens]PVE70530.1 hypothetical protein DCP16_22375 [Sphingomonas sp. TPD3009]
MSTPSAIRKVYQGAADRHQMFRMFDRHAQRPHRFDGDASALYAGEWFEITEREHDYMFEILPPLWIRGSMFAMREFLTGSVTSVFFALRLDGVIRHFHGYCDLSDGGSVEQMRLAIIERETRSVRAMTRYERLEHIWSATADAYRGYSDEAAPQYLPGQRVITLYSEAGSARLKLLDDLTDDEIASKLPIQLRHLARVAAAA